MFIGGKSYNSPSPKLGDDEEAHSALESSLAQQLAAAEEAAALAEQQYAAAQMAIRP